MEKARAVKIEKTISKGRSTKTIWSAVYAVRDGLRAGPKMKYLLSVAEVLWRRVEKHTRNVHARTGVACVTVATAGLPYSVTSLMQLAESMAFPNAKG